MDVRAGRVSPSRVDRWTTRFGRARFGGDQGSRRHGNSAETGEAGGTIKHVPRLPAPRGTAARKPPGGSVDLTPGLVRDGRRNCIICRQRVRVRYAETDRMGIAYNAHYLAWFEVGRTELMRCSGLSYREIEERGFLLPLVAAELKLRSPIAYDDLITIDAWVGKVRSRTVSFAYGIYRDEELAAEGSTTHACVASRRNETVVLPDWLKGRLAPLTCGQADAGPRPDLLK